MSNLDPQADFTLTLVKVARLYRQGVDEALSGLGLSDALALPVVLLGRRPEGMRQNLLADELGVEGPSLVRLLDRLVENGLVERREDPADRRAKIVHLTEEGRVHSRDASRALDRYRSTLLDEVSEAEVDAARRLLHLLEQRLLSRRDVGRP
jgi:MarR family transcriptional regulator for hemolysin